MQVAQLVEELRSSSGEQRSEAPPQQAGEAAQLPGLQEALAEATVETKRKEEEMGRWDVEWRLCDEVGLQRMGFSEVHYSFRFQNFLMGRRGLLRGLFKTTPPRVRFVSAICFDEVMFTSTCTWMCLVLLKVRASTSTIGRNETLCDSWRSCGWRKSSSSKSKATAAN